MGRDKALLPFGEELLLQRTVRLLSEVVPEESIVLVAAADQMLPSLPAGVEVIRDEAEGLGPLPAIAAGLGALGPKAETAFVTGCDAPLLKSAAVRWLFDRSERANAADGVVLQDAERLYPLLAVYRTRCAGGFAASSSGEPSLHAALRSNQFKFEFVPVETLRAVDPGLKSLVNCNTPEEYRRALRHLI